MQSSFLCNLQKVGLICISVYGRRILRIQKERNLQFPLPFANLCTLSALEMETTENGDSKYRSFSALHLKSSFTHSVVFSLFPNPCAASCDELNSCACLAQLSKKQQSTSVMML
ncbi:hypothetical protein M758_9G080200 [Ceratodon purpureus]|nr:hypothetical protein M758_9G080200 [Ceratodon purpureus]